MRIRSAYGWSGLIGRTVEEEMVGEGDASKG